MHRPLTEPGRQGADQLRELGPLRDFLAVDVLDLPTTKGVRDAVEICDEAIQTAQSATI